MYTRRGWIIGVGAAGVASLLPAAQGSDWPQFRGPDRNGISKEMGLLRKWPAGGPKVLWSVPVTQGYAAAAIVGGRVYHHDYDEANPKGACTGGPWPTASSSCTVAKAGE